MAETILIVDEETTAARTLAAVLESAGYRARRAATVPQARQSLQAQPADAVILDDQVEGAHGFGRRLKHVRPAMPLLILSSVPAHPKAGSYADAFVGKPEDPRRLLQRLAKLLTQSRRAHTTQRNDSDLAEAA